MLPTQIPAAVRSRLRGLRLTTRRDAGGAGLGQHASRSRGAGLEFAQYRAYEPGDDLRRIDWKLYARSDRHFVREAERDSPLELWILIDATASMRQADLARPDYAKFDAARLLAACAIEIALRQGDGFGIATFGGSPPCLLAPGAGARQRDRCLIELARVQAAGQWPAAGPAREAAARIASHALVLLLSDFFDAAALELARRLAAAGREVLTLQILAADERDFPFRGGRRFLDPESALERQAEAGAVREEFLRRFALARAGLARECATLGIRHGEHWLDEPLDAPLQRLFAVPEVRR
ncbi:MAG: DUF58 domain-containing protein [Dokdonella sp.]|uniref:DUF58 domain-containing protein n=2 Tax=Dokdonella sp. TaxID=2291710 RepID=UPI0025C55296|nr:DUF58 domain-containing protein [Dokdonella sp.]MBX3700683.1 DUF58 domain-containing protein [Dokdonella sp.]